MSKKFLIYALKDPYNLKIRYIGKSCNGLKRPREHSCPKNLQTKKTHCVSWIKSLGGRKPLITILTYGKNPKELDMLERFWIKEGHFRGWDLTNHDLGGGGILGYRHTEEAKKKIGDASKKLWKNGDYRNLTEEIRFKMGSSLRGKCLSKKQKLERARVQGTKPFRVFKNGELLGTWENKSECSRDLSICRKMISNGLRGKLSPRSKYSFQGVI